MSPVEMSRLSATLQKVRIWLSVPCLLQSVQFPEAALFQSLRLLRVDAVPWTLLQSHKVPGGFLFTRVLLISGSPFLTRNIVH